jgi:hypothetical protein
MSGHKYIHYIIYMHIQSLAQSYGVGYILIYLSLYICPRSHTLMASYTKTKLYKVEAKSVTGKPTYRHSIFLEKAFVEDSQFPFRAGESLIAKIDNGNLIITKAAD